MEEPILPQIIGFTLNGIEKYNRNQSFACDTDINNFIRDHNDKLKYISWNKNSNIHNTYRGYDIQEILKTVTVHNKVTVFPLTTYFENSEENWDGKQIFRTGKTIITTNAKIMEEIIKTGRSSDGSFAPKFSVSHAVLNGECIPERTCNTIAVKRFRQKNEIPKIGKGMKLGNYLVASEDGQRNPFDMYAIMCMETDDAIFLYYAEIDSLEAVDIWWLKPTAIERVEIKLMPDVFKKKNTMGQVIAKVPVENNVEQIFKTKCPELEEVNEFMPVLEGILRRAEKLKVAYIKEDNGKQVWKHVRNYDFLGMGLFKEDVAALNSFAKSLFTLELPRPRRRGAFAWMNIQTRRSPTGSEVICVPIAE